jgi:hypothetical protein
VFRIFEPLLYSELRGRSRRWRRSTEASPAVMRSQAGPGHIRRLGSSGVRRSRTALLKKGSLPGQRACVPHLICPEHYRLHRRKLIQFFLTSHPPVIGGGGRGPQAAVGLFLLGALVSPHFCRGYLVRFRPRTALRVTLVRGDREGALRPAALHPPQRRGAGQ